MAGPLPGCTHPPPPIPAALRGRCSNSNKRRPEAALRANFIENNDWVEGVQTVPKNRRREGLPLQIKALVHLEAKLVVPPMAEGTQQDKKAWDGERGR